MEDHVAMNRLQRKIVSGFAVLTLLLIAMVSPASAAVILGTDGNDILGGTQQRDIMRGFRGNDVLAGYRSRDHIYGGLGRDRLVGWGGSDFIYGQGGQDALMGGQGDDRIYGGPGRDEVNAGAGDDIIWVYLDGSIDTVRCGPGADVVYRDPEDVVGDACETSVVATP